VASSHLPGSVTPVTWLVNHRGLRASVLSSAVICPLAVAALLVQARAGSGGLDGALYHAIQGRSWLLVVAGMVFTAANLLLALVCSLVVELRLRRAWVREHTPQGLQGTGAPLAAAGPSQDQPRAASCPAAK
jgi:hypothetical protein